MRDNIKNQRLNTYGIPAEASVKMVDWKRSEKMDSDSSGAETEKIGGSVENLLQVDWDKGQTTPPESSPEGEKPIEVIIDMMSPSISNNWFTASMDQDTLMDEDYLPRFERNVFEHLYNLVADHPNFIRANYLNCKLKNSTFFENMTSPFFA